VRQTWSCTRPGAEVLAMALEWHILDDENAERRVNASSELMCDGVRASNELFRHAATGIDQTA
jgi:hypothetical protein